MNVKLVSLTQSQIVQSNEDGTNTALSPEELIVYTARVSNPDNQMNMETASKLIGYLIRKKHWSPFEMVDMTVEIKTSRAIAAQILRHRSFSFQEFSQRYSAVTEMEPVQIRKAGSTNRQSSLEPFNPKLWNVDKDFGVSADVAIQGVVDRSLEVYQELIQAGSAKECARMILPLTTQTTMYMKGSIRSWIHYLQQRTDEHTQLEHRDIALAIQIIFEHNFPDTWKALVALKESERSIQDKIKSDPELYFGFQSNIAMAFVDEWNRPSPNSRSQMDIANEAAKNFLNLWLSPTGNA